MDMKFQLHNGKWCEIDFQDFLRIKNWRWTTNCYGYVCRWKKINNKRKQFILHRIIMRAKNGQIIDHVNCNILDNRRENLRFATRSQNAANMKCRQGKKFKGITLDRRNLKKPWMAQLGSKFLGRFDSPENAARAYDVAAIKLYGKFARTNF